MLSDESSSDSETGRFKGRSEKQEKQHKNTRQIEKSSRSTGRERHSESSRYHRGINRKREEKERFDRAPRDRHRYPKHSPVRRWQSNDRSPNRKRSRERKKRVSVEKTGAKDTRSRSREKEHQSRSRAHKSVEDRMNTESQHNQVIPSSKVTRPDKLNRSHDRQSLSPEKDQKKEDKVKRSEVHKSVGRAKTKESEDAIVVVEDRDSDSNDSKKVQPGSYYNMKPIVLKEKSLHSSEIDSSDDEKLRAKLLKLEKELHQAKKKKHKKKHRKKDKSIKNDKDIEAPTSVEVSSTTDIQDKLITDASGTQIDSTEVTSTQKNNQVESNEEGEIISDDDSQADLHIDPNDLRHKLKRSVQKHDGVESLHLRPKMRSDVCGPALPPHLQNYMDSGRIADTEGPALPPHLRSMERRIGPSIPDQLRKKLEEGDCEVIKCESSDEEGIGPVPAGAEGAWSDAHRRLEERALQMKIRSLDGHSLHGSKAKSREQWMLELPEGKAKYLGLEARSFRAKEGPDMTDRSSWTDTPEQKARKDAGLEAEDPDIVLQREARAHLLAKRDEDQERAVKKHKKKHRRDESLLEMHERKLKKKKKKAGKEEKQERRPFSRDVDLQAHRFDEAQKRAVIKKAQHLDSRFSRGEAKYL